MSRRASPLPIRRNDDWSNLATINGTSDQIWARAYLDGFGRKWKELSEGPDAINTKIEIDRAFNERGLVESESAPYYPATETRKDESYNYDGLDRLISQTHPDGKVIALTYGISKTNGEVATVQVTDETSRNTSYHFDAFGKLVERVKLYGTAMPQAGAVTQY